MLYFPLPLSLHRKQHSTFISLGIFSFHCCPKLSSSKLGLKLQFNRAPFSSIFYISLHHHLLLLLLLFLLLLLPVLVLLLVHHLLLVLLVLVLVVVVVVVLLLLLLLLVLVLLLLLLALQPTGGFSFLSDSVPFHPFLT